MIGPCWLELLDALAELQILRARWESRNAREGRWQRLAERDV